MLQPNANTGLLMTGPRVTDFIAGVASGIVSEIRNPNGNWEQYLPEDEAQIGVYFDTMACVTFSALNDIETQCNFLFKTGRIPDEKIRALAELGVLKDGKFNFSDRFTAKMSGTTRQGNYLVKVWDSIRNDGLLPESDWPYPRDQRDPVFDWDEYYKEIPQELKDKAKKILDLLEFKYEWLIPSGGLLEKQVAEWLKMSPLQIATAVCPPWNTTEVIKGCSLGVGHATLMYKLMEGAYGIFDHYSPFRKRFAFDYPIPNIFRGMAYVKGQTPKAPTPGVDSEFAKRMGGKILLAVEDKGAIYFVNKSDGKKIKIGRTPEEVEAFLKAVNDRKVDVLGITNADLAKIPNV